MLTKYHVIARNAGCPHRHRDGLLFVSTTPAEGIVRDSEHRHGQSHGIGKRDKELVMKYLLEEKE